MMLRLDHQPPIHWSEAIESCAKLGPGRLDQSAHCRSSNLIEGYGYWNLKVP
jgi:hypothetical protein